MKTTQGINWFLLAGVVILTILLFRECNTSSKSDKLQIALINALNDSLSIYQKNDSVQRYNISVMETEKVNSFTSIDSKNLEILRLQEVIKDYKNQLKAGSSVTKALVETKVENSQKPTTHFPDRAGTGGGIREDSVGIVYIYPEYQDTLKNKWVQYTMLMNQEHSELNLKVYNEYDVIIGKDKKGTFVDVVNYNPYSSVKSVRSYQVKIPKQKSFGLGIQAGYGLDYKLKPTPYIGVGLSYNILKF